LQTSWLTNGASDGPNHYLGVGNQLHVSFILLRDGCSTDKFQNTMHFNHAVMIIISHIMCLHFKLLKYPQIFTFSHSYHTSWYYQSFIYSPTDGLVSCLKKKKNIKIYNSARYIHQLGPNICSHTTTVLTTYRCILIDYFNNCNFSKHELMRSPMMA
jgi:hypothetical protein